MNYRSRTLTVIGALVLVAVLSIGGGWLGARLGGSGRSAQGTLEWGVSAPTSEPEYDVTRVVDAPVTSSSDQVAIARSFQQQFRSVAAETLPVVVEINVVNRVTQRVGGSPLDFFFGTPREGQEREREFRQDGMGSGVIVARDGRTVYALTNHHVAGQAEEIEVVLYDDRRFDGTVVGSDDLMDIALLSFETDDEVPIAPLGDSSSLQPGDWVFAVGNPLGFESTITAGIVSATARTAQAGTGMSGVTDYIQTDAAINRGNSGGPLVNLDGEVVGINTWIASQTGGSIGLGFAIPINNAKRAITDFLADGEVAYSWLGVQVGTLGETLAHALDIDTPSGAFVSGVYEDSPAYRSGVRPGDVITRIGDVEIDSSNALVRTVANLKPGERTPFEIIRNGERIMMTVETGRRTAESGTESPAWPGISVTPLNDEIRERLELSRSTRGVVITGVATNSPASDSGLRPGDTIIAVNGTRVGTLADFYRELNSGNDEEVQFRIIRDGRQIILGYLRPTA
ncbi:MAG: Do family serine endopeptidase [Spirochaetota bacterium]